MRSIDNKEIIEYLFSDFEHYDYVMNNKEGVYKGKECQDCGGEGEHKCSECYGSGQEDCAECAGDGNIGCRECGEDGKVECPNCHGSGIIDNSTCDDCGGSGNETCSVCDGDGSNECYTCNGSGKYTCYYCDGSGTNNCELCDNTGSISPTTDCYDVDINRDVLCGYIYFLTKFFEGTTPNDTANFAASLYKKSGKNWTGASFLNKNDISKIDISEYSELPNTLFLCLHTLIRFSKRVSLYSDLEFEINLRNCHDSSLIFKIGIYDTKESIPQYPMILHKSNSYSFPTI